MKYNNKLLWLSTVGGPLILIPRNHLASWHGVGDDEHLAVPDAATNGGATSDYDRACAVPGYVGLVAVGSGFGIVLGDDTMQTTWCTLKNQTKMLVRWVAAETEDDALVSLDNCPEDIWAAACVHCTVSDALVLFDAAFDGQEIEESLDIDLEFGEYYVQTAEYRPDDLTWLVLHRFVRQAVTM